MESSDSCGHLLVPQPTVSPAGGSLHCCSALTSPHSPNAWKETEHQMDLVNFPEVWVALWAEVKFPSAPIFVLTLNLLRGNGVGCSRLQHSEHLQSHVRQKKKPPSKPIHAISSMQLLKAKLAFWGSPYMLKTAL